MFSDCSNGTFDYRKTSFLDTDLIVIGGGGIIDTKFWALNEANIEEMRESKIPIAFLNVNIYQESLSNSQFIKKLFDLDASWWVRDKFTHDELKN